MIQVKKYRDEDISRTLKRLKRKLIKEDFFKELR